MAGGGLVANIDVSSETVGLGSLSIEGPVSLADEAFLRLLLTNAAVPSGQLVGRYAVFTVSNGRVDCVLIERIQLYHSKLGISS